MAADPLDRVPLGRTSVRVSRLGFGAAVIGGLFAAVSDEDAQAALNSAWHCGLRYFDTAPHYGAGLSELRIGGFLSGLTAAERAEVIVSTKVGRRLEPVPGRSTLSAEGFVDALPNVRVRDYSYDGVLRQVEDSLGRLGRDRVDVLYIHDPDDHWQEALDGAFPALAELRRQGLVGAIGVGMNQWELPARFVRECDLDVVMLAGRYTLLDQSAAAEFLPLCLRRQVSVVAAGVFNSGLLADPRPGRNYDYAQAPAAILARAIRLRELCAEYGVPLAAAAAQFPLRHSAVSSIVLGSRTPEQVASGVGLLRHEIPSQLWTALAGAGVEIPG